METKLDFEILPQPDDTTCGPTCLHAIYRYYGDELPLEQVIREVRSLDTGGTLAVLLGCHALSRGYAVKIFSYNLQVFDPTWFELRSAELAARLREQLVVKTSPRMQVACEAYLDFIEAGGQLRFDDLSAALLRKYLDRGIPILTGLSATYLHRSEREFGPRNVPDSVRGLPVGHFVVLAGYDRQRREVLVADPMQSNPIAAGHRYVARIERVLCAILLGIVTYDANLLIIEPSSLPPPGPPCRS